MNPAASTPFSAELRLAMDAAHAAAELIFARTGADHVREKGRADLVTEVDEAVERLVAGRIRARFPDDAVVGEELSSAAVTSGRRWIVDPVDGTTNFVHGHPFVCVSIAFADDEGPAAAVIHAPFLREVFHAARGGGAFLNGDPIRVSGVDSRRGPCSARASPSRRGRATWTPTCSWWPMPCAPPTTSDAPAARPLTWPTWPRAVLRASSRSASPPGTSPPASCW